MGIFVRRAYRRRDFFFGHSTTGPSMGHNMFYEV